MGFDSPSSGGGGGGGGGGMTLLDQGTVSLNESTEDYTQTGIGNPSRNLWCNLTFESNPFEIQSVEQVDRPTVGSSVAVAATWNDNADQWSVVVTTGSNTTGDYRWFLYELPTG